LTNHRSIKLPLILNALVRHHIVWHPAAVQGA
jgi:hypothetical protein